jgi:16S rRNA (guanine527-N7)-methyltransferase
LPADFGVSRETEPSDDVLAHLFGPRVAAVREYATVLATTGVERGLLGPREVPRIWHRHILNCAVIGPAFPPGASVCDVGSGAGLPGIVLALARPDLRITLVEPLLRRATFLSEVVARLELSVAVLRARAEELGGTHRFDFVTARAVAPLTRLVDLALPLCAPGGELLALKGATAETEAAAAAESIRRLGGEAIAIETYGRSVVDPPTTVVRIKSRARRPA